MQITNNIFFYKHVEYFISLNSSLYFKNFYSTFASKKYTFCRVVMNIQIQLQEFHIFPIFVFNNRTNSRMVQHFIQATIQHTKAVHAYINVLKICVVGA